jgi:hypothetical protein
LAAHSPRKGFFFLLDQKEAKNQVGKNASLPHRAFTLQTGQNHGLESFAPLAFPLAPRFSKISYALATLKATIVLSDFARSCFADGEGEKILSSIRRFFLVCHPERERRIY